MSAAEQERSLIWRKDVNNAKVKKSSEIKRNSLLKLIKVLQTKNNTPSLARAIAFQTSSQEMLLLLLKLDQTKCSRERALIYTMTKK